MNTKPTNKLQAERGSVLIHYRDGCQDVTQQMEENLATSDLVAWPGSAWLLLSFSPFPVRHPGDDHGRYDKNTIRM